MSPEQKSLVQTTWTMVVPIADTAAGLFYDRLFAIDASTPAMFTSTNMAEQKKKLMQALAFVIGGLEKTEQLAADDPVPRPQPRALRRHRQALRLRSAPPCCGRWSRA